jgi:hypothetical protein
VVKKVRRVNPNAARSAIQKGGHGLPSRVVKRKKVRRKQTPAQAAYRQKR